MTRKTLERGDFRLLHYAGEVTYCVVGKINHNLRLCCSNLYPYLVSANTVVMFCFSLGFLDKNNDLLYRNIKDVSLQFITSFRARRQMVFTKQRFRYGTFA